MLEKAIPDLSCTVVSTWNEGKTNLQLLRRSVPKATLKLSKRAEINSLIDAQYRNQPSDRPKCLNTAIAEVHDFRCPVRLPTLNFQHWVIMTQLLNVVYQSPQIIAVENGRFHIQKRIIQPHGRWRSGDHVITHSVSGSYPDYTIFSH